jgi:hypothetical protein
MPGGGDVSGHVFTADFPSYIVNAQRFVHPNLLLGLQRGSIPDDYKACGCAANNAAANLISEKSVFAAGDKPRAAVVGHIGPHPI